MDNNGLYISKNKRFPDGTLLFVTKESKGWTCYYNEKGRLWYTPVANPDWFTMGCKQFGFEHDAKMLVDLSLVSRNNFDWRRLLNLYYTQEGDRKQ